LQRAERVKVPSVPVPTRPTGGNGPGL
jgi:hypothetical protein